MDSRTGQIAAALALAAAILLSPSLLRYDATRMTNDEAMYAWKTERIAARPGFVVDRESWRRHPPALPALTAPLARAAGLEPALSLVTKLALAAALLSIAGLGLRLAGPVAAGAAFCLLALDPTVRDGAPHFLLDLPLVAVLCTAAALWSRGGRARLAALALALLAPLVKSYGALVPLALVGAGIYERLPRRLRIAAWGAVAIVTALVLAVGQLGLARSRFYWLAPQDPARTATLKLYHVAASFDWLAPGARGRTLVLLLVPLALFCARFLRLARPSDRTLLLFLAVVPALPLAVTRVVEPRAQLLVMVPIYVAIAAALAGAQARIADARRRRAAAAALTVLGVALLAASELRYEPKDPCRYAGQWEIAPWLRANVDPARQRVFAASSHQTRLYTGLEFEKDGGPLYGENEWTGIPRTLAEFESALDARPGGSLLVLSADPDGRPPWLRLDGETGARLRDLGFGAATAVYLPADPRCEPATPEAAAAEDAFWTALGLSRTRPRADAAGRERLAGAALARPSRQENPSSFR